MAMELKRFELRDCIDQGLIRPLGKRICRENEGSGKNNVRQRGLFLQGWRDYLAESQAERRLGASADELSDLQQAFCLLIHTANGILRCTSKCMDLPSSRTLILNLSKYLLFHIR
jgi:hypothetical protein